MVPANTYRLYEIQHVVAEQRRQQQLAETSRERLRIARHRVEMALRAMERAATYLSRARERSLGEQGP